MSLDRYTNKDEILSKNGKVRAIVWKDEALLQLDEKSISPEDTPEVEVHFYSTGIKPAFIGGGRIDEDAFEVHKDELFINFGEVGNQFGIERGSFEAVINVHKDLLGDEESQALYIEQISGDRREVHVKAAPGAEVDIDTYLEAYGSGQYQDIEYETQINADGEEVELVDELGRPVIKTITERPLSDDIALNFGKNEVFKIIAQKDWNDENDFVVRLLHPLPAHIQRKDFLWVVEELTDSYVDNVNISGPGAEALEIKKLQGPNLTVGSDYSTVTETNFKTWNDLLDTNLSTSQEIVDAYFSGSLMGVDLGIDYTGFPNFVHYSSAVERVNNFKYKMELLEYYDSRIATLQGVIGSDSSSLGNNIAVTRRRRDTVIGGFDNFEKWLYNEPTGGLSTHGVTGSIIGAQPYSLEPWPKFLNNDKKYVRHHTTSSFATDWFHGVHATASLYDQHNEAALMHATPEHIRRDPNNDQYELFVNMIGHHFDIMWSYIENLTKVYKPEEQPKLGQSKEVLYEVAESMGWTLANGKQATQLWQYKLGVDSGSGGYRQTGSMFSKSDEAITTEVWRRIVNNMPYLLKTKGTTRSIKALMNAYGIPQSLLSIREYGGPKVSGDTPLLIEDRFTYALQFNSGSNVGANITWAATDYSSSDAPYGGGSTGSWGIPRYNESSPEEQLPGYTKEWRIRPATTRSMVMYSHYSPEYGPTVQIAIEHTASFSGSGQYGRLFLCQGLASSSNAPMTASSDWLPIYDGDWWNIRYFYGTTASSDTFDLNHNDFQKDGICNGDYFLQIQKSSDYIDDKIIHRTSCSVAPTNDQTSSLEGKSWLTGSHEKGFYHTTPGTLRAVLGGTASYGTAQTDTFNVNKYTHYHFRGESGNGQVPGIGMYSGSMQEFREWIEVLDQRTFDLHTTNPTSYVSTISATSSFDTLVRHYTLGTNLNAISHAPSAGAKGTVVSSSHPNQALKDFSPSFDDKWNSYATASGFAEPFNVERGNYYPWEETYYVQGVSLGGTLPKSQKIRIEKSELKGRLSPVASAERSRFDKASIDTNRLGLFYSHADQVNKEIFNQIGDVELDDYVGDPDDEFELQYSDLEFFAKEYWKKYTDRNDVNAYIKIFSQFDFALFNQIKQLLAERIDEATGLIVEPHILERRKVRLAERPIITPRHFNTNIPEPVKEITASILPLSQSIPMPQKDIHMTAIYHSGSGGYSDIGNFFAPINAVLRQSGSMDYCDIEINPVDELPGATGALEYIWSHPNPKGNYHRSTREYYKYSLASDVESKEFRFLKGVNMLKQSGSGHLAGHPDPQYPYVQLIDAVGNAVPATSETFNAQFGLKSQYATIQDITVEVLYGLTHSNNYDGSSGSILTGRLYVTKDNMHGMTRDNFNLSSVQSYRLDASKAKNQKYLPERFISHDQKVTQVYSKEVGTNNLKAKFKFENIHVPRGKKINFQWNYQQSGLSVDNTSLLSTNFYLDAIIPIHEIKNVCHDVIQTQVLEARKAPGGFYERQHNSDGHARLKIKHYGTGSNTHLWAHRNEVLLNNSNASISSLNFGGDIKYFIDQQKYYSQSRDLYHSQSLGIADFAHDFPDSIMTANQRYNGSKLVGPGVNQPSIYSALGNEPVVEVYGVNPNRLIFRDPPEQGNPGRLIVR